MKSIRSVTARLRLCVWETWQQVASGCDVAQTKLWWREKHIFWESLKKGKKKTTPGGRFQIHFIPVGTSNYKPGLFEPRCTGSVYRKSWLRPSSLLWLASLSFQFQMWFLSNSLCQSATQRQRRMLKSRWSVLLSGRTDTGTGFGCRYQYWCSVLSSYNTCWYQLYIGVHDNCVELVLVLQWNLF